MWNLCSSSKIVSERQKQRSYDMHQKKLTKMKAKMKIIPPSQPDFVYSKHKLEMSRKDRLLEIDHQNEILLNKMKKISRDDYTTNKLRPEAQNLKTLNQHVMDIQAEEIYNQNRRICRKLLKTNSYYPTIDIMDKTDQLERVRFNISENARRVKSVAQIRPQSSLTYRSKFYRSKVSKYDEDGNNSQQNLYKYMRVQSHAALRPETAPTRSKSYRRPYSSQNPSRKPRKTHEVEKINAEEQEGVTYIKE